MEAIERLEKKIDNLSKALLFKKDMMNMREASEYTGLSLSH